MSRRVTLQSIADQLGYSAKTVSNAFNRPDQLSAATRQRILETATRIGYAGPDPIAAGLRRGRVGALGFAYANTLTYAFEDPVSVELLAGISSMAESAAVGLLLVPGAAIADRNAAAVHSAAIDGLVISSLPDDDPLLAAALSRRLPAVVIDQPDPGTLERVSPGPAPAWVGIDDRAAAAAAAEHVLALGHRELGVISFALDRAPTRAVVDERAQAAGSYAVTRHRLEGYRDAATRAGVDWRRVPVVAGTNSTVAEGAAAAVTLLERTPRPTAILCLSDRLAQGAIETATARGLQIPDDLSIVGFDDAAIAPELGLTTVRQPTRRKGELAAAALLALIAGGGVDRRHVLGTELVVRTSTGKRLR
jgi:DNA-binding LacI/PurR family transcriptional regulator